MKKPTCAGCQWYEKQGWWEVVMLGQGQSWYHFCQQTEPRRTIAVNEQRRAPARPGWCQREN